MMQETTDQLCCLQCGSPRLRSEMTVCETCEAIRPPDVPSITFSYQSKPSARDNLVALIGKVFAASTCIGLFICYFWLWQQREYTWIIVLTVTFGPSTIYTLNRFVTDWWIAGPKRSLIHYTSLFMTVFAITLMVGAVLAFVVGIALIGLVFSRRRG